ncbi:RagB/SusD family nutrient uptake outer membrane protein [uncultured Polaribacter sp.]|uniref:RagB/SusD family nutrient uptake outer membrane protein n=1 Tax=uncultured Polaribacter sp. TaxID=174711 RepID=UPI0026137B2F|nr:RagB/SusD family nutrient uptake outer membrane protein [uncultured Polaribacter sp.]
MKNILKISILCTIIVLSSCEDFLNRTPLDEVNSEDFYKNAAELRIAANDFYQTLPGWASLNVGFNTLPDTGTDMVIGQNAPARLSGTNYNVPATSSAGNWGRWDEIRETNWFLDRSDQAEAESEQEQEEINHYIGEGYFFRAYYYFEMLISHGDLPILDRYFDNNDEELVFKARDPRSDVANFILSDLDKAISLLQSFPNTPDAGPRISKEAAQLLKARVALFEGTWEKYHAGTVFGVTDSDGSSFLQIAADTSEDIIDSGIFSLSPDYGDLFIQIGLSGNSEVILWRDYNDIGLDINNVLQLSWPNRCAYTRFAIRSYLCSDGLPTAVSPLYVGDQDLNTIENNRDSRLMASIMVPGDLLTKNTDNSEVLWANPDFSTANAGDTGYESQKYRNPNIDADINNFTRSTSRIIMRYAEALLIFAEAKAELGTISQGDLDKSINLLRVRVGMPNIVLGAIVTDPNWPNYGYALSDILYEIRRERSVEFLAEGFRASDLYRWRAHSLFDGDQPRGAYYDDGVVNVELDPANADLDSEGYILPFNDIGNYNFDPTRAYLLPIPLDELSLNPNLTQNPGW